MWTACIAAKHNCKRWHLHTLPSLPVMRTLYCCIVQAMPPPSPLPRRRLVITLRSLYTYLRLLPAYRMYRACKVGWALLWARSGHGMWARCVEGMQVHMKPFHDRLPPALLLSPNHQLPVLLSSQRQRGANFTLGYRLHSTLPGRAGSTSGSRRLQSFRFGGVDTPYGQFRISVEYQPTSTVTILEQTTSPPSLPQIIADYLGNSGSGGGEGDAAPLRHAMSLSAFPGQAGAPPSPRQASVPPLPLSTSPSSALQQVQPGSSPAAGGGRPIRRSWSTSMRASQSPHRGVLSQSPSSELPSPVSARGEPAYGSAPQPVRACRNLLGCLPKPEAGLVIHTPSLFITRHHRLAPACCR